MHLTHVERLLAAVAPEDLPTPRAAGAEWFRYRRETFGFSSGADLLTAPGDQPKLGKNDKPTYTFMAVPASGVGAYRPGRRAVNLCPAATPGCRAACLSTAGRGAFSSVQMGRACRTGFMLDHPAAFLSRLHSEVIRRHEELGGIMLRLNCVSDIRWEIATAWLIDDLGERGVTLYDYTAFSPEQRPDPESAHYYLTRSAKETHTDADVVALVHAGHNVALPFAVRRGEPLPETWHGVPVIDGDRTDDRTADPRGVIVGLRAKGKGRQDKSGFVRQV
jgi:hypothetical protein